MVDSNQKFRVGKSGQKNLDKPAQKWLAPSASPSPSRSKEKKSCGRPRQIKIKYAASPTPATTAGKATRQRDALGDRAVGLRYAHMSQQAQYFAKVQPAVPTAKTMEVATKNGPAAAMAL